MHSLFLKWHSILSVSDDKDNFLRSFWLDNTYFMIVLYKHNTLCHFHQFSVYLTDLLDHSILYRPSTRNWNLTFPTADLGVMQAAWSKHRCYITEKERDTYIPEKEVQGNSVVPGTHRAEWEKTNGKMQGPDWQCVKVSTQYVLQCSWRL